MTSPIALNSRGEMNITNQPFLMVARSNNTLTSSDVNSAPTGGVEYFLLTRVDYQKEGTSSDRHSEAIFTPFFDGTYSTRTDDNSLKAFAQMAQGTSTPGQCTISINSGVYFPFFDTNVGGNSPFAVQKISPAIMTGAYVNGSYVFECFNTVTSSYDTLWNQSGDKKERNPYENAVFIGSVQGGGSPDDNNSKFSLQVQYPNDEISLLQPPNTLFSGYPYRIVGNQSGSSGVFPFRNFLPQVCQTTDTLESQFSRYINYITLPLPGGQFKCAQFPGAYYDTNGQSGTVQLDISSTKAPGGGKFFNFQNDVFDSHTNNLKSTTQIYFIPLSYFLGTGSSDCTTYGDINNTNDLTPVLNTFINQYFRNQIADCTKVFSNECIYSNLGECQIGLWWEYCLSNDTGCSTCFGGCSSKDYCRIASSPDLNVPSPKIFVCGASPAPEPPPDPAKPSWWKKYSLDFVIAGAVLLAIVILVMVFALMGKK